MMICTAQPITQKQSFPEKKLIAKLRTRIVARWKKVDGNLVCQWTTS